MKFSDSQLIDMVLAGDKNAFGKLMKKYQGAVYGLAFHLVKNFTDAQDLTQEAFIEAYRCLPNLKDKAKFASWLHGITANVCKMWLRKQKGKVISLNDAIEEGALKLSHLIDAKPTPDKIAEEREFRQRVMQAIESLPKANQLVVTMYYLDELSYKEIAAFLEIPTSTVKGRLQQGRNQLKRGMLQMAEEIFGDGKLDAEFTQKTLERILKEGHLSPTQKEVFTMYHFQKLQIKEIAESLGINQGSVKVHHLRARRKLRPLLAEHNISIDVLIRQCHIRN